MIYTLPSLPYPYTALEPIIDGKTMEIHHTKHHAAYINALNKALENYPAYASLSVSELLTKIDTLPLDLRKVVQNNGGGHSNHSLFWHMMTPHENEKKISDNLQKALTARFESYENFKTLFLEQALKRFGSGWGWLVYDPKNKQIDLISTANQDSPFMQNLIPLLGVDVWEHAYYLQYQNRRSEYLEKWFTLINWKFVSQQYQSMIG